MEDKIIYEQPLNERIRTFLRLEFLFLQASHFLPGETIWDSRAALWALMDISNIFGRADLKKEVLQELERLAILLEKLEQYPNVDRSRLSEILKDIDRLSDQLHSANGQIGQALRQDEFLTSIRQRSSIPGGTCGFDVPGYHYWLQQPAPQRVEALHAWRTQFDVIHEAIELILGMLRESTTPAHQTAVDGFFQQSQDPNASSQLIRVSVPQACRYFPEISGGKHRFTVRFMSQTPAHRPEQTTDDVDFELSCCSI